MKFFRLFKKKLSLRIVNIVGLFILFACLLLSTSYIKRELSYDRHYNNADRIVRMSMQRDNQPVDGRIWSKIYFAHFYKSKFLLFYTPFKV